MLPPIEQTDASQSSGSAEKVAELVSKIAGLQAELLKSQAQNQELQEQCESERNMKEKYKAEVVQCRVQINSLREGTSASVDDVQGEEAKVSDPVAPLAPSGQLRYPVQVKMLELDIITCDDFLPQDRRMFAKETLYTVLKEATSHEVCVEQIVSKFETKFGGSWHCVTWADKQGEADIITKADQSMRLRVRGQIFLIAEARDSLTLPVVIERDEVEVVSDNLATKMDLSEELVSVMVSMMATNALVEECGQHVRGELMTLSEESWIVAVGTEGSFFFEEQVSSSVAALAPTEHIVLKARQLVLIVHKVTPAT